MTAKTPNIRCFVAKTHCRDLRAFSDNKCPLFTRLGVGVRLKGTMSPFFTVFVFYCGASLRLSAPSGTMLNHQNMVLSVDLPAKNNEDPNAGFKNVLP